MSDLLPPIHPKACKDSEPYLICQKTPDGNRKVETQPDMFRAIKAAKILNEHEVKNNREANYFFCLQYSGKPTP